MNFNPDIRIVFTFVILTFTLTSIRSQDEKCFYMTRQHPNGVCGKKLRLVHKNLCDLIYKINPDFYPDYKRSGDPPSNPVRDAVLNELLDIPLSDLDLPNRQLSAKLWPWAGFRSTTKASDSVPGVVSSDLSLRQPQRMLSLMGVMGKRDHARPKRDLVCECCYNQCSVEDLAHYC